MPAAGKKSVLIATAVAIVVASACGSNNPDLLGPKASDDAGGSGSSSGSGSSGSSSGGGGDDASVGTFSATDAGFSLDALAGCASTTQQAKELPLDLYLMLDTSSSMNDLVGPMRSKWSAVQSALTTFANDPASAGIGVGLQYFPLTEAGVPTSCTASSQCGSAAPCFLKACLDPNSGAVYPCDSNRDCPPGLACLTIGQCANDHNSVCVPAQMTACGNDANGFDLGACQSFTTSTCILGDSCTPQDYATPAVPIALLPGAATAITASLAAHQPTGNTPTAAALEGAINQAQMYAAANPGHSVVAVLATDGLPDECTPSDIPTIARLAAQGLSGSPSIKTFAIGVFTPNDKAMGTSDLDQIASAGGTKTAFVIDTSTQNVEQQFTAALTAIRGASLPCNYEVPLPESGTPDFMDVNVVYTTGAGVTSGLPYVASASRCGNGGGWYYDVAPEDGGTPNAILVCPTTCSALQTDTSGRVDVVTGCVRIAR
jgi:Mg-chelatase subunit ChlD